MTYEEAIIKLAEGCSKLADHVEVLKCSIIDLKSEQEELKATVRDLRWKVKALESTNNIYEHKIGTLEKILNTHFPSEELLNELTLEVKNNEL